MKNSENLSAGIRQYRTVNATNMRFPYHIHRVYEIIRTVYGTAYTKIDGIERTLKQDECALVLPMQYHSYSVDAESCITAYIFLPEFIPEFDAIMHGKEPVNPVFTLTEEQCSVYSDTDIFAAKEFLYSVCGNLLRNLKLTESNRSRSPSVLDKVFLYVDKNYPSDCSLKTVADALKYDYTYLSKYFKAKTGTPYNTFLNKFRVNKACYMLISHPKKSITQIASEVGYDSIRTFNREFVSVTGFSPMEYKKSTEIF